MGFRSFALDGQFNEIDNNKLRASICGPLGAAAQHLIEAIGRGGEGGWVERDNGRPEDS